MTFTRFTDITNCDPQKRTRSIWNVIDPRPAGPPAFEFHRWMTLLESHEREVMVLRFVEEWEYHEIAAAQSIPIGTVKWRVFSAKKKLGARLKAPELRKKEAA